MYLIVTLLFNCPPMIHNHTSVDKPVIDVAVLKPLELPAPPDELPKLEPLDLPPELFADPEPLPEPEPEPPPLNPPPELATLPLAMSLWVQTPSAR